MAAFPFTVNVSGAGSSSLAFKDSVKPKQAKRPIAEMWLPVWSRELAINELRLILSEGRASLGRRATSNGVDFARSLSELGVDRGLSGFVRIAFLMRNGQSFLGIPLGLFEIGQREKIDLLRDYDAWLDSFRYSCRMKEQGAKNDPPPRFPAALRRIDTAVFDFCKYGGRDRTAIILAALGAAERELALGDMPKDKRRVRRPLAGLSADWIDACDDGSPEYRLARSLAFMRGDPDKTGPLRRYLEPVKLDKGWLWTERGGHVVWAGGDVFRNLGAVLVRRLMDAEIRGEDRLPLDSDFTASLADIGVLLAGEIDVQKLEDLIWGLALVTPRGAAHPHRPACVDSYLPSAYAVLKLTLLPGRLEWTAHNGTVRLQLVRPSIEEGTGIVVKPEPAILTNLHAGDVQGACEVACRRLRASGFTPLASRRPDGSRREITWSAGAVAASRLLAALLFPIERHAVNELANLVLRRPKVESLT